MFNIGGLFGKFIKFQNNEICLRQFVVGSLKNNTGINTEIGDIEIKNDTILIKKLSQAGKNVLFMKKGLVLEEINSKQNYKKINNIKY